MLLLPTAPGCGECMITLNRLDVVYPDYRGLGVQVVLLDITRSDLDYWAFLAGNFNEPEYIWGMPESADFVSDYEITTLGAGLLIAPDGTIVYRNDRITMDILKQLFELSVSQSSVSG